MHILTKNAAAAQFEIGREQCIQHSYIIIPINLSIKISHKSKYPTLYPDKCKMPLAAWFRLFIYPPFHLHHHQSFCQNETFLFSIPHYCMYLHPSRLSCEISFSPYIGERLTQLNVEYVNTWSVCIGVVGNVMCTSFSVDFFGWRWRDEGVLEKRRVNANFYYNF